MDRPDIVDTWPEQIAMFAALILFGFGFLYGFFCGMMGHDTCHDAETAYFRKDGGYNCRLCSRERGLMRRGSNR